MCTLSGQGGMEWPTEWLQEGSDQSDRAAQWEPATSAAMNRSRSAAHDTSSQRFGVNLYKAFYSPFLLTFLQFWSRHQDFCAGLFSIALFLWRKRNKIRERNSGPSGNQWHQEKNIVEQTGQCEFRSGEQNHRRASGGYQVLDSSTEIKDWSKLGYLAEDQQKSGKCSTEEKAGDGSGILQVSNHRSRSQSNKVLVIVQQRFQEWFK